MVAGRVNYTVAVLASASARTGYREWPRFILHTGGATLPRGSTSSTSKRISRILR